MKMIKPVIVCLGLALALPALAADQFKDLRPGPGSNIKPPPEQLDRELQVTETGIITNVDRASHLITFQTQDGTMTTVVAKSLKNLNQIKKGDLVDITYYKSTAANLVPKPAGTKLDVQVEKASIVSEGGVPGRAAASEVRVTIKILSVDPYKKTITYKNPNQQIKEVSMNTPRLLPYLKTVKEGDIVEVIYTRAVAASVTPKQR